MVLAIIQGAGVIDINKIKKEISKLIKQGALDERVVNCLVSNGAVVPMESELWDYKREHYRTENGGLAKTILQVASFYNTYGGYILYGIDETDSGPLVVGVSSSIGEDEIKDNIKNYLSEHIPISYREVRIEGPNCNLGILYVPKRNKADSPAYFSKNGPSSDKGKLLFEKDQAYIRYADRCVPAAKRPELQLLVSDRLGQWERDFDFSVPSNPLLEHNLPDRSVICPMFFGREEIIDQLWQWITDDFSVAKVLAGHGGLGKTSIAYEFCTQVCQSSPGVLEKVVWLTGKRRQFSAYKGDYIDVARTDFGSFLEILHVVAGELSVPEEELSGLSERNLLKLIREHLNALPALVVIDDVDSLPDDQQKKVMEFVLQVASSTRSKFLLTTRMNHSYSSELTINVPGLSKSAFDPYIDSICGKYKISLNQAQVSRLYAASAGSPMYADSILRLVRLGERFDRAIELWKGSEGEAVREATLLKEIESLSNEARTNLYAMAVLGEASVAELSQITGYGKNQLERLLSELGNLYLISEPSIIESQPRYSVSEITASFVRCNSDRLVGDSRRIDNAANDLRKAKSVARGKKIPEVGYAISQAIALFRQGGMREALITIDEALKKYPGNSDLLVAKGEILMGGDVSEKTEARRLFRQCYQSGQRKELLFLLWYRAQQEAADSHGMIDVAGYAVEENIAPISEWYLGRAIGYLSLARARRSAGNVDDAIEDLRRGFRDILQVVRSPNDGLRRRARDLSVTFTDEAWEYSAHGGVDSRTLSGLEFVLGSIRSGDLRIQNYRRLLNAINYLVPLSKTISSHRFNLLSRKVSEIRVELEKKRSHEKAKDICVEMLSELNAIEDRLSGLYG